MDLREVRRELRKVLVENYRLSVNVLRGAARLHLVEHGLPVGLLGTVEPIDPVIG